MEGDCEFQLCDLVRTVSPASMHWWSPDPRRRASTQLPHHPWLCPFQTAAELFQERTKDPEGRGPHWLPQVEAVCDGGELPLFPQPWQPWFGQRGYCVAGGRLAWLQLGCPAEG